MLLKEMVNNEGVNDDFDLENAEDSDEDDHDEKALLLKKQKKAELTLARKYKDIRKVIKSPLPRLTSSPPPPPKAIDDDMLLFQDDIFTIEPNQGQIWPNSEMTITLQFKPFGAHNYTCPAFCNVSCN